MEKSHNVFSENDIKTFINESNDVNILENIIELIEQRLDDLNERWNL